MADDVTPDVVRVRAGKTADKRRSWHVARVAADIQRSLAEQSPVRQARSSWHPNDDWSLSYHQGSGWATTADSGVSSDQVGQQQKASFSIASWADRPVPKEMDALANYSSKQPVQHQMSSSDDDSQNDLVPPVFIVPVILSTTDPPDVQVLNHHKRIVTNLADNYIDVVVKELRGATPCGVFPPASPFFMTRQSFFES